MKKETVKLVLAASGVYYLLLLIARGTSTTPPLYLLAVPLLALVLILLRDLSKQATGPVEEQESNPPSGKFAREVQELTQQIQVGTRASSAYFDSMLLARLREILVEKVSLETGMDRKRAQELLMKPGVGPGLLKDERLHRLLYSSPPARGQARIRTLEEVIARIEAWKP